MPVLAVDRPLDRDGTEVAILAPEATQRFRLVVRSPVASAPAGRVRITIEPLDRLASPGSGRWLAELAESDAAAAYRRGDAEGRRQALAAYRRAAKRWQENGNDRGDALREALAVYSIAVLHRLLGEPRDALGVALRAADRFADLDEPAWQASALNEIGLARISLGELDEARTSFESALEFLRTRPDPFRRAIAASNVCLTELLSGALREGIDCYARAAPLYRAAGDPQSEAMASTNSGRAYDILGEPDRALASYERALAIQREHGDASGEALTLNNLAILHATRGDLGRALTLYGKAAEIYRALDEKDRLALALSNAGSTYSSLGETARARSFFEQALELQRQAGDRRGEALSLTNLARIHARAGDPARALALFEQALELRRRIGHRRGEGSSHLDLGNHLLAAGELDDAVASLEQALAIAREVGDREVEAQASIRLGEARMRQGDLEAADTAIARGLAIFRSVGARLGEASALTSLARLERRRGRLELAHGHVGAGLELLESARAEIVSPDLRASFLADRLRAYELEITLLMDLHREDPVAGYDALALASSERARARSLLDLLGESATELGRATDAGLERDRRRLLHRLAREERARRRLATDAAAGSPQAIAEREHAVQSTLAELDRVEAEIRRTSPAFSALVHPPVLGASEIRELLTGEGGPAGQPATVLLVYSLGAERSFLWWVEAGSIEARELPPREAVETAARQVFAGLSTLDPTAARREARAAAALSEMILGPVAERLGDQRLAIVADGALHQIPFAALPDPTSPVDRPQPLLLRHAIVHLPSASALALQRRLEAGREPAPRHAFVVADPVFGADDPRARGERQGGTAPGADEPADPELTRSAREIGIERFDRLPASLREAEAIASLAAPGEVALAIGFAARREAVAGNRLAPYRYLHFATHGLVNDLTPRLSGLVLSQLDAEGRLLDGFLRLHDLSSLSLNAELVVLSGCRTASGREIRGEGLVGLTRGFFYAGARRVLASLWRVQDRATAQLMERFYRFLWLDGLAPDEALRKAQLSLAGERRHRDPYYWSGFILQGDWLPASAAAGGEVRQPRNE